MTQFPFAHTLTMTYRVQDGALEVHTRIDSMSAEPMPVAIGFHPYFQLTDSNREDWHLSVAAKTHWLLDERTLPTGQTEPITNILPDPKNVAVKDVTLDDIFTDLERDEHGLATMSLKGKSQQVDVVLGPKFKTILVLSRSGGGRVAVGPPVAAAPVLSAPAPAHAAAAAAAPSATQNAAPDPNAPRRGEARLRADGRHLEFDEPGAEGPVQGAPDDRARRIVGGKFLGTAEGILTSQTRRGERSAIVTT